MPHDLKNPKAQPTSSQSGIRTASSMRDTVPPTAHHFDALSSERSRASTRVAEELRQFRLWLRSREHFRKVVSRHE
jgi:hypothetical protein